MSKTSHPGFLRYDIFCTFFIKFIRFVCVVHLKTTHNQNHFKSGDPQVISKLPLPALDILIFYVIQKKSIFCKFNFKLPVSSKIYKIFFHLRGQIHPVVLTHPEKDLLSIYLHCQLHSSVLKSNLIVSFQNYSSFVSCKECETTNDGSVAISSTIL